MLFRRSREKTRLAAELEARITQEAERGRRLAIYDQRTGLLARWYFELRLLEETHLCQRYGMPMTVLTLRTSTTTNEAPVGQNGGQGFDKSSVVARSLWSTDLATARGGGEYAVCLLHCNRAGAAPVLRRLMEELAENDSQVGMAVYPDDDCEGKALIELALSRSSPWRARTSEVPKTAYRGYQTDEDRSPSRLVQPHVVSPGSTVTLHPFLCCKSKSR